MTTSINLLPFAPLGISRKLWTSPEVHILDLHAAQGAAAGPLCDKHGSLSGTLGNDKCDPSTK